MPPDQVYTGPVPQNQDMLIHLSSQGAGQLYATPYWRPSQRDGPPEPWPQVLTSCVVRALGAPESMWVQGARAMGRTDVVEPPLTDLPIPDLTRWAQQWQGNDWWAQQYLAAKQRWEYR